MRKTLAGDVHRVVGFCLGVIFLSGCVSGEKTQEGGNAEVEALRATVKSHDARTEALEHGLAAMDVRISGLEKKSAAPKVVRLRAPQGFRAKPGTLAEPYTKTGWAKEIVHEKTGIEMMFIPAGEFMMGSPPSEPDRNRDEDRHRVRLTKPFYMGKYEVTHGQWRAVMGNNPSQGRGSDRLPVDTVSWDDCQGFLKKAGGGLRLPTEAEWEYACRAGTTTPFNTGVTISPDEANYNGDFAYGSGRKGVYRERPVAVGSFKPNAWGLYDMHGNLWESCQDWYESTYNVAEGGVVVNPTGPGEGVNRVLRGGTWGDTPQVCRSANRRAGPTDRRYGYGFRVAVDANKP